MIHCPACQAPLPESTLRAAAAELGSRGGGVRPGAGRRPIPTDCPRCGEPCESARVAWTHCRGVSSRAGMSSTTTGLAPYTADPEVEPTET